MKKKPTIFDIISNISETRTDRWEEFSQAYTPFIINKFLSMNDDTVGFAEMMNRSKLNKKEQYHFYLYAIPNRRRFFKYVKEYKSKTVEDISKYFNVKKSVAKEYHKLLSKSQIKDIQSELLPE